jgi:uncharacterized membrane protein
MIRAVLAALAVACTADTSTGIAASEVICPSGSTLTYENFGQAFVNDTCLACHVSQRPTLTTQAAVQASADAIIRVAVTSSQMPAGASLAVEERRLLGEWLACGAP